jgi:tRNA pseudouridine65 synthase
VILYRDEHLIALCKPTGMLVHRGWAKDGPIALTVARELAGAPVWPVHRLDRGTSGVLMFALSAIAARGLHTLFEQGLVRKRYLALVRGCPPAEGVIDHPVRRGEAGPRVPAVTEFRRLMVAAQERVALVEARPRTGRLHQIRRHLKHLGHPVIGDANYGKGALNRDFRARYGLARLALHALAATLTHPHTGEPLTIFAPVPADLAEPLARLGLKIR